MFARIRKALMAGAGAGAAAFGKAMADGKLDTGAWIQIVGSAVVVGALTWWIRNEQVPAEPTPAQ